MLVSLPELPIGRMVHELTGIPFVSISIVYYAEPERGGPLEQYVASFINPFRQQLGLAPVNYPQTSDGTSPELALFAISRHIPRPEIEWQEHYHTTGFFFLDDDAAWQPDQALTEFLAADKPPIVITLGSMVHDNEQALADLFFTAVEQVGCRAILQNSWGELVYGRRLPPHIHTVGYVSHRWLFARAACVVHHTGIGTIASVFRAGVPSICIPHAYEQFATAQFAHAVGCAGPPIPYRQLTLERLRRALLRTLNNPRYVEAAQRLGNKIRSESGVQTARLLIERLGRQVRSS